MRPRVAQFKVSMTSLKRGIASRGELAPLSALEPNLSEDWLGFLRAEALAPAARPDFVTGVLDACIPANAEGYACENPANMVHPSCSITPFRVFRPKWSEEASK